MKTEDFEMFRALLMQRSGLVLTPDKAYLLESRLLPVTRKWNFTGLEQLAAEIRSRRPEKLLREVTEAMTTNESSFFRDTKPFDQFRQHVLPTLMTARASSKRIRVWSAACSTGQEPYSLAMMLQEDQARLAGWQIDILGTDLSGEVLDRARAGLYTQFEVQRGMPITLLVKYFRQQGDKWELTPEIRKRVQYRECNLLTDLGTMGKFDVIFCRNVLIYFDQPTKTRVLEAMAKLLPPDGVLYLGGAETVLGLTDRFRPVEGQRGIYRVADGPAPSRFPAPDAARRVAAAG